MVSLKVRFARLGVKKLNKNIDRWLNEWENIIGKYEEVRLN
jgi:hypothetical protein